MGILVDNGSIVGVEKYSSIKNSSLDSTVREFDGIICPGMINAHTHLELSTFRSQDLQHKDFVDWVTRLVDLRTISIPDDKSYLKCAQAKRDAEGNGTAYFINVGNDFRLNNGLGNNQLFQFEQLGINESVADRVYEKALTIMEQSNFNAAGLGIHSPYSVSPRLMKKIKANNNERHLITSMHLSETSDEVEFIRSGSGRMKDLLDLRVGSWKFTPTGLSPVRYVESLGLLDEKTLCVHCVFVDRDDVRLLAERGSVAAVCVRSNRFLSGEVPPIKRLLHAGVRILIGTDSTASSPDIDMFAELAAFYHEFAEVVSPSDVMKFATADSAEFVGRGDQYGEVAAGKSASLVFVPFEGKREDALEFLVTAAAGKSEMIKC